MAEEMNETERYYREAINDPYKCMETVKKAPWSIRYAKEQTLELCMEAVQNDGEVHLIHASSSQGRVVVENRSILQQLKDNKKFSGIRIIRPQNFENRK